ncbi:thioredoxin domain-containing protein [Streptomyces sp. NBC_00237]|uniref:thioredoxin family protein n=1 Tax=Streptomyces sp. NBC_00237 TaxID=2975687 RepID=UPI0022598E65|nr:thioredoxin domain-containing protein [Streptomyces sp. NBC_00237]MCX5205213.1 thioredoxin domain-containing protein [Streptomyces sp. NBC_00237]
MASRIHQPRESDEFDFVVARVAGPVLAYFSGTWPKAVQVCKEMDVVAGEVAEKYAGRLTVVKADITRCPLPVKRYGVAGAPTFVLIRDGEAVAVEAGPMDRAGFGEFLGRHL